VLTSQDQRIRSRIRSVTANRKPFTQRQSSSEVISRYIGTFTITKKINPSAYRLHLPNNLTIHPVFHISELRPYVANENQKPPPIPSGIQGEHEWEVESIRDHRTKGRGVNRENWYLVHWKGYPDVYDTWEPESNLLQCRELVQEYQKGVATPP